MSDGTLNGTSVTGDPQLQNTVFNFSANAVPKLALRLKSTSAGGIQFYFATTVTNAFGPSQLVTVSYTNPPNWQTLVYNLGTNPAWAGKTVTKMRFDPASVANADFDTDWIRASDGSLNDRLNFGLASPASSTNLPLCFYGGAGLTYQIEALTNLASGSWEILSTFGPLSISGWQFYDYNLSTNALSWRFFRIHIAP